MNKTTFLILFLTLAGLLTTAAQKKKDLINEIAFLKSEIDSTKQALSSAKRKILAAEAESETFRNENASLRDANTTLLKNLSGFSELSKKKTENASNALARLAAREKQLSGINDAITQNDSTAIALLTKSKQVLGDDSKLGTANGDIIISNSLSSLFGEDTGITLTEESNAMLAKVAEIIRANPKRMAIVEGLNITGEFELTYQQVGAMATALSQTHGIAPEKINILVKDGNFKEGINIRLQPDYGDFYNMVKKDVRQ